MSSPTFYLETSVWGSLAARQPRDRKQVVHRLLRLLDGVRGICVISEVVLAEIKNAPGEERERIEQHIDRLNPIVHRITDEVQALADAYITAGVLPAGRESDALHIAVATGSAGRLFNKLESSAYNAPDEKGTI